MADGVRYRTMWYYDSQGIHKPTKAINVESGPNPVAFATAYMYTHHGRMGAKPSIQSPETFSVALLFAQYLTAAVNIIFFAFTTV